MRAMLVGDHNVTTTGEELDLNPVPGWDIWHPVDPLYMGGISTAMDWFPDKLAEVAPHVVILGHTASAYSLLALAGEHNDHAFNVAFGQWLAEEFERREYAFQRLPPPVPGAVTNEWALSAAIELEFLIHRELVSTIDQHESTTGAQVITFATRGAGVFQGCPKIDTKLANRQFSRHWELSNYWPLPMVDMRLPTDQPELWGGEDAEGNHDGDYHVHAGGEIIARRIRRVLEGLG